jgi:hypothetical protein
VRRVKLPSGGNQRIVWDGLQAMFKAAADVARKVYQMNCRLAAPCFRLRTPSQGFVRA